MREPLSPLPPLDPVSVADVISRFSNATRSLPSGFYGGGSHECGSHRMDGRRIGRFGHVGRMGRVPEASVPDGLDGSDTSDGLSAVVPCSTERLNGSGRTPEHALTVAPICWRYGRCTRT